MDIAYVVIVAVTVVVFVAVLAAMARRLLGIRFGLVRLLLAGLIALALSGPISQALASGVARDENPTAPVWFLVLAAACSLLIAMPFLVVAEALIPTGRFTPIAWLRGLRARLGRTRRYLQILAILVRHGLGPYLRGRQPTGPGSRARGSNALRAVGRPQLRGSSALGGPGLPQLRGSSALGGRGCDFGESAPVHQRRWSICPQQPRRWSMRRQSASAVDRGGASTTVCGAASIVATAGSLWCRCTAGWARVP